jgi:hypothetical protein
LGGTRKGELALAETFGVCDIKTPRLFLGVKKGKET